MRLIAVLASLLLFVAPAYAADIEKMVGANFLLKSSGDLCSATLVSQAKRLVLTNYHCIEGAISRNEREETQPDGTVKKVTRIAYEPVDLYQHAYGLSSIVGRLELRAEITGADRVRDLALLRILSETTTLPAEAALPPEGYTLKQGQDVYGVGNPAGFENTISRGILSHLYREYRWSPDQVATYIQTDAAIAGGSSGGALYSLEGYLIGVPSAGYRGAALNFAIPFRVIREFLAKQPAWTGLKAVLSAPAASLQGLE